MVRQLRDFVSHPSAPPSRATVAFIALSSLFVAAGTSFAKPPDCAPCQAIPKVCMEIKRCMKSCNTTRSVAYKCLQLKHINEAVFTDATGREPDDFDAAVDQTAKSDAAPSEPTGKQLPDRLPNDALKKGIAAVDYSACKKEVPAGGTVQVKLVINPDGKVVEASCSSNNALSRCVLPKVKTATFPPYAGAPTRLTYPVIVR